MPRPAAGVRSSGGCRWGSPGTWHGDRAMRLDATAVPVPIRRRCSQGTPTGTLPNTELARLENHQRDLAAFASCGVVVVTAVARDGERPETLALLRLRNP